MSPLPGEVWLADLGLAAKTRPVIIVSRRDPDPPRALVLYVPLTTQGRGSAYEVPITLREAKQILRRRIACLAPTLSLVHLQETCWGIQLSSVRPKPV